MLNGVRLGNGKMRSAKGDDESCLPVGLKTATGAAKKPHPLPSVTFS